MQLRVFGYPRLNKERDLIGVNTRRKPVDHHLPDVLANHLRAVVMGC